MSVTGTPTLIPLRTRDGATVSLRACPAGQPAPAAAIPDRRPPILLLPGIGSNREVFVDGPSFGLGAALARAGLECWLGQMRYAETSAPRAWNWNFTDLLHHDLPLIVGELTHRCGRAPIVLGYSLGGMLSVAAATRGLIEVPALILDGVPLKLLPIPVYPPLMRVADRILRAAGGRRVPVRLAARGVAISFWSWQIWSRGTVSTSIRQFCGLIRRAAADVSQPLLAQTIDWVDSGVFRAEPGADDECHRLGRLRMPLLVIASSRDRIAPLESARPAFERAGSTDRTWLEVAGLSHIDLAHGPAIPALARRVTNWVNERF